MFYSSEIALQKNILTYFYYIQKVRMVAVKKKQSLQNPVIKNALTYHLLVNIFVFVLYKHNNKTTYIMVYYSSLIDDLVKKYP